MFFGQYDHNIDEKGRVTIPAQYRDLLASGAYITRGFDKNLIILCTEDFNALQEKIKGLSVTNLKARKLSRLIFSNADMLKLDKAGRLLIPHFLRSAANLDKQVKIVGTGPYLEIWALENWSLESAEISDEERARYFEELDLTF